MDLRYDEKDGPLISELISWKVELRMAPNLVQNNL